MPANSTEYTRRHRAANPGCYRAAARRYYLAHRADVLRRIALRRANGPGPTPSEACLARHGVVFSPQEGLYVLDPSHPAPPADT